MKKMAVLLSLVMVAALAVPAAAAWVTLDGKVDIDLRYDSHDQATAEGELELGLGAEVGNNIKGVVNTNLKQEDTSTAGDDGVDNTDDDSDRWVNPSASFGDGPFSGGESLQIRLDSAYIETTGGFFKDAPRVTTKLGRFNPDSWNDWIADITNGDSISVTGINAGPVALNTLYGWVSREEIKSERDVDDNLVVGGTQTTTTYDEQVAVISGSGKVDILDFKGTYVSVRDRNTVVTTSSQDDGDSDGLVDALNLSGQNTFTDPYADMAFWAGASPADGVTVGAAYASNGEAADNNTAYKVTGELSTMPDVKLTGEFFSAGALFDPEYAHLDDDDETTAFDQDSKGFKIGAETMQAGLPLSFSYETKTNAAGDSNTTENTITAGTTVAEIGVALELYTAEAAVGENNKTTLELEKTFAGMVGNGLTTTYTYTKEDTLEVKHEIGASTTLDTPLANNVALSGAVTLQKPDDAKFETDAVWTSPNGFLVGVHYANYDRTDDWGDDDETWGNFDFGTPGEADGFAVTAGIEVAF